MSLQFFEKITRKAHLYTNEKILIDVDEHPFDSRNIHIKIIELSKKLFDDGHYSQATFESCKYIDTLVKSHSGLKKTGLQLMMDAFNENNPNIKLSNLKTQSEIDEQMGYKFLFSGSSSAIRNPRGHESNFKETMDECLDYLSFLSMLIRRLEKAGYNTHK